MIYFFDIGLLGAFCNLDPKLMLEEERLFGYFGGVFTENYVLQELVAANKNEMAYWIGSRNVELDFLLQYETKIYPLEVKAGKNKTKHSLKAYGKKYEPSVLSKMTRHNLLLNGDILNYPLYLASSRRRRWSDHHP